MLLIHCPYCGPREESEFSYGGEAHIIRPSEQNQISDEDWAQYLYYRKNPRGRHLEQWNHAAGCGRWFNAERDTETSKFTAVYKAGEPPPGGGE